MKKERIHHRKSPNKHPLFFGEDVWVRGFIFIFLLLSTSLFSQTSDELFEKANALYKDGKYQEAIETYQQIKDNGEASSELYYNLGNAYYKLNKVAPTVYNYEKALQLNPNNADARNNLVFANRLTLDRIEPLPKNLSQRFNEQVLQKLHYNTWAILTVVFSAIGAILFLLYYFAQLSTKKRLFFITSMVSFFLMLVTFVVAYQQYNYSTTNIQAIVFTEEVSVKNEPTKNSDESFTLHEGTKVTVLDAVDDWKKIKLIDGKIGWLKSKFIKEL